MSPILPQRGGGIAVFMARPVWGPGYPSVCIDTSVFDNRVFLAYSMMYTTKAELVRLSGLPPNLDPQVWVGFDSRCLEDSEYVHIVSGLLIRFTPPDEGPGELSSIGMLLLSADVWSEEARFPMPYVKAPMGWHTGIIAIFLILWRMCNTLRAIGNISLMIAGCACPICAFLRPGLSLLTLP